MDAFEKGLNRSIPLKDAASFFVGLKKTASRAELLAAEQPTVTEPEENEKKASGFDELLEKFKTAAEEKSQEQSGEMSPEQIRAAISQMSPLQRTQFGAAVSHAKARQPHEPSVLEHAGAGGGVGGVGGAVLGALV